MPTVPPTTPSTQPHESQQSPCLQQNITTQEGEDNCMAIKTRLTQSATTSVSATTISTNWQHLIGQTLCKPCNPPQNKWNHHQLWKIGQQPPHKRKMDKSNGNGTGKIAQCHQATNTPGKTTVFLLDHGMIKNTLPDRKITNSHILVDCRLQKPDPNRARITVRWNLIEYPHEITTKTADLVTAKILWNIIVSTPNANMFMPI